MFQNSFNSPIPGTNNIGKNYHYNHNSNSIFNIGSANKVGGQPLVNKNNEVNNNSNQSNQSNPRNSINQGNSNQPLPLSTRLGNLQIQTNPYGVNNYSNQNSNFTNMNIFGFNKTNNLMNNTNKFLNNVNSSSTMNQQERAINFGQDPSENTFKKNLRKPAVSNLIQNTSYNIITGAPFLNNNTVTTPNNNFNMQMKYNMNNNSGSKPLGNKPIENLFFSYKDASNGLNASNRLNASEGLNRTSSIEDSPKEKKSIISHPTSPNKDQHFYYTIFKKAATPSSEAEYSVRDCFSVKEFSYKEDANCRYRGAMEDMHKVVDKFGRNPDKGLFSIYDGHGGEHVAKIAVDRIPEVFDSLLSNAKKSDSVEDILINTFHKVDDEIKLSNYDNMGCTATVVYISKEKDPSGINARKVVFCANTGDSRCVLVSNYGAKRLSYDHKASDSPEVTRIVNAGGIIFAGRVFGQLILTRALGDHALKKYGVIATPYISKHFVSDRDKYIVIASDGVWDVITDDDMYRLSLSVSNSEEYVKLIVKNSLARGSQDNISCIVIKL